MAGQLQVTHEIGGLRHYLDGEPVHCGELIAWWNDLKPSIVPTRNGPTAAASTEFSSSPQFMDSVRIRRIPVHVDDSWPRMVW
jgi:hypothetical protein